MVFMRSTTTLELSTSIRIDPRTFGSKVWFYSLDLCFLWYSYCFQCLFILCDRFKEPRIDLHAPYTIQGMGME